MSLPASTVAVVIGDLRPELSDEFCLLLNQSNHPFVKAHNPQLRDVCASLHPDLIVLNVDKMGDAGIDLIQSLLALGSGTRVTVLLQSEHAAIAARPPIAGCQMIHSATAADLHVQVSRILRNRFNERQLTALLRTYGELASVLGSADNA